MNIIDDRITGLVRTIWSRVQLTREDVQEINSQGWDAIHECLVGHGVEGGSYYATTCHAMPIRENLVQGGCPICGIFQIGIHPTTRKCAYICGYSLGFGYDTPCRNTITRRQDSDVSIYRHGL